MPARNKFFNTIFSAYYFLKHLHHFSKIKSQKKSHNSSNQGFSYYFAMIIEGSGSGSRAGSGSRSIPLTSGSGSGRPKNMWIRIRIRNTGSGKCSGSGRIRIHNTAKMKAWHWQYVFGLTDMFTIGVLRQFFYFYHRKGINFFLKLYRYCNECLVFRILLRAGFWSSDCGDGVQHCRQGLSITIGRTFWLWGLS